MKQFFFIAGLIFLMPCFLHAQSGELWVKSGTKGLYIEHKVAPKEGIYALGRLYNVHPRHIANYNGLDFNKGLVLGQQIKIPLTDTNFNQKSGDGVPVFYKVGEKEGLMTVSNQHNKVALDNLRSWNNLGTDKIDFGTALIVGHLVSKEMKVTAPVPVSATVPDVKTEVKKTEPPLIADKPNVTEVKKAEVKTPLKEERDYAEIQDAKKDGIQVVEEKKPEVKPNVVPAVKMESGEEGFFKWHFDQQAKQQPVSKDMTVTSGIFKTTSGWTDGKYYLLIDGVQPGTIIRISNPANNKNVYAKVLGQMEGINMNKGLDIRISHAAASVLGIAETDKFIVKVNY